MRAGGARPCLNWGRRGTGDTDRPPRNVYLPGLFNSAAGDVLTGEAGAAGAGQAAADQPPTPAAEPAGAAALLPFLRLTATVEPEAVAPGEQAILTWRIENLGAQGAAGLLFTATLPRELVLTPADVEPPLRYDPVNRILTWAVAPLAADGAVSGRVTVRPAGWRVGAPATVPAELRLADGTLIAQAEAAVQVRSPAPRVTEIGPAGGSVLLEEGRVSLTFPPGALAEAVRVWARPLGRPMRPRTSTAPTSSWSGATLSRSYTPSPGR